MTKILLYILVIIVSIVLLILIIGLLLPTKRTATIQTSYDVPPEVIYNIIINNENYSYRSDIKEIIILEKNGDIEVWDEIDKKNNSIRFRTAKKEPYSRYEFEIIKANGFTGYWIGELQETENGGTIFTTTETIYIKNPFIKIMSYIFFDIEGFMKSYQKDLKNLIESTNL